MIGKKFGKWDVLDEIKIDKPGKHYECLCECGEIKVIPGTTLRAGRSKQCTDCQYLTLYDPQKEIDKKYGKWKVIRFIDIHRKLMRYECECECGTRGMHCVADLRAGKSKQCTLCHNRQNAAKNITHGQYNTSLYKVWTAMKDRCSNPNSTVYKYYGGRGIKVCERWNEFENFYEDMGERPKGLTLDRIDNNKGYSKENCRWITHKENCNNRYYPEV